MKPEWRTRVAATDAPHRNTYRARLYEEQGDQRNAEYGCYLFRHAAVPLAQDSGQKKTDGSAIRSPARSRATPQADQQPSIESQPVEQSGATLAAKTAMKKIAVGG